MHRGLCAEPGDVAAGSVGAAALPDAFRHQPGVGRGVEIEGRAGPVGFGRGRFLGHTQHAVGLVDGHYTALQQFLLRGFVESHDARRLLGACIVDEARQAEVQHVVAGNDQIAVGGHVGLADGKFDVAHGAQPCFVAFGAVVEHGDVLRLGLCPFLEVMGKAMVRDDDIFIDATAAVDVVDEPVKNGLVAYFQQRFREVFC